MKCALLTLEEPEISEAGGVASIARRMLELGERKLREIASSWTAENFLMGLGDPTRPDQRFVTRIATLLAEQRYDEARILCEDSAARGLSGGFLSSKRGTFNEMVMNWVAAQRIVENHSAKG